MSPKRPTANLAYLENFTSRKVERVSARLVGTAPDSLAAWIERYLTLAVVGVRSEEVIKKVTLHLQRFVAFYKEGYGHDRITIVLKRDVLAWQQDLVTRGLAAATVNSHLASLSGFTTWVHAQAPRTFPVGDPAKGIGELGLPPLEPRTLRPDQVRSLKNVCDRLPRLTQMKGRRWARPRDGSSPPVRERARPLRDRAIVYILLSTGLRREELTRLDLDQLVPSAPVELRTARQARITRVQGKGNTVSLGRAEVGYTQP